MLGQVQEHMHLMEEELEFGMHRGREERKEVPIVLLCVDYCESVSHIVCECPVYCSLRNCYV